MEADSFAVEGRVDLVELFGLDVHGEELEGDGLVVRGDFRGEGGF